MADGDGHFRRQQAQFRNWIDADPTSQFPAEKGRYVLYLNYGTCSMPRTMFLHHETDESCSKDVRGEQKNFYLSAAASWYLSSTSRAHRTNIVRSLKGLEDIVELAAMDFELTEKGWVFNGKDGSEDRDPLYGFEYIRDLYWKADPNYKMRCKSSVAFRYLVMVSTLSTLIQDQ